MTRNGNLRRAPDEQQILPFEAQGRHFVQNDGGKCRRTEEGAEEKGKECRMTKKERQDDREKRSMTMQNDK